jgi:tetratricopeptide (TPR) repeat protein
VRALDLDDSLPDAQLAYAVHITWLLYNWEEGDAAFQRAIDLNPSFAEARMFYSHYLTLIGRATEGTEQMRLAVETAYAEGDYAGAMLRAAEALEKRSKTIHVGPLAIGELYEYAGEAEKAIDWYELGYQITGPDVPYLGVMTKSPKVRSNPRFIKLLRDIKLDYWADKYSQPGEV